MAKNDKKPTEGTAPVETVNTAPASAEGASPTPPVPPAEIKKTGKDEVSVPRSTLEAILKKQETQDEQIEKLTEQNKKLEYASDRKRLNRYDEINNGGELIRTANIAKWEGKYIMGWETVKNEVRVVDGKLIENQITKIFLDEGEGKELSELELNYGYWYENIERKMGNILGRNEEIDPKTKKKTITFSMEMEDGRTLKISPTFINL